MAWAWWAGGFAVTSILVALWVVLTYNRLVSLRNRVQEAWAGIDVQLQRRTDLVPNLVRTVQGYQVHERDVLESVTEARTRLRQARGPAASAAADEALEGALGTLFAVAESYPQLRASENFLALQRELATLEEDISLARRFYNALAQKLNTTIDTFPTVLVAGPLGFVRAEYFDAAPEDREVPRTEFPS